MAIEAEEYWGFELCCDTQMGGLDKDEKHARVVCSMGNFSFGDSDPFVDTYPKSSPFRVRSCLGPATIKIRRLSLPIDWMGQKSEI